MLVTQFHVSPMHRCSTRTSSGVEQSARPLAFHTIVLEAARRKLMVIQMKGNAMPGGVQLGRLISFGTGILSFDGSSGFSKPPRGGRDAGMKEKTRERRERKRKSGGTQNVGSVGT